VTLAGTSPSRDCVLGKLKAAGESNRAIAHRLGIDEKSVRKGLRRLGWTPRHPQQLPLAAPAPPAPGADSNLSAFSAEADPPPPPTPPASAGATRAASPALAGQEREPG
jgi:hypothetical protein